MPPSSLWQWSLDPLRIGTAVYNAVRQETGSIGGFAHNATGEVFVVSCAHVLLSSMMTGPEPILPAMPAGAAPVADADPANGDVSSDYAAAKLRPGIRGVQEVVGLGPVGLSPIAPVVGMRVCKMGAETLLTEGTIDSVGALEFTVAVTAGFPIDYELSGPGDSGALWLQLGTRSPVGLHRRGGRFPRNFAAAVRLDVILPRLGLTWNP